MNLYNIISNVLKIDLSGFTNTDIENIFTEVETGEIESTIDRYIHNERDRKIIKRRLIDGVGFEDLAEENLMSVRQIKTIVSKCEWIVFRHV